MPTRIAILGGGVMGETLLTALLKAGHRSADLVLSEKLDERAAALRERHGIDVVGIAEAVRDADVVLVVVKPQDVVDVLREAADAIGESTTVVSLAAGVRLAALESALPSGTPVVRAMPNTPALVGQGVFGISAGSACDEDRLLTVADLLATGGEVVSVDEGQQDALTAVSGSGPAYVFYLAEAMVAGGAEAGLDPETAATLATRTIVGAAALLADSEHDAAELRRRVTSPHGTTEAAITTFDEAGVMDGLIAGVLAAARRSADLSGPSA